MDASTPPFGRVHARRLREIHRSAGWPCQDIVELELLAAGMLERVPGDGGRETLRLTDAGIRQVVAQRKLHQAALGAHEALVQRVAREMGRAGRLVWCGLGLRARLPAQDEEPGRWCLARPDVFSIRNSSVPDYLEPVVHEVKVRRADLLADLRRPDKRAAYLALGECWYVLGADGRGRAIAEPDEIPPACGVLLARGERLELARAAPRPARAALPFEVWMALARATPVPGTQDEEAQGLLGAE